MAPNSNQLKMVCDPVTGANVTQLELSQAERYRKLDAANAAAEQQYKNQVERSGYQTIAAKTGADLNSIAQGFKILKSQVAEESKKAFPNLSGIAKPEQYFTYTAGNTTKPIQNSAYLTPSAPSASKTPSPSYLASNLASVSKSPYPSTNYGVTPPPINPSLNIASTLIYKGNSTNGADSITGQGYINGYEGDDYITGSSKNDLIYGGAGNDRIISGGGNDRIYAGAGDDVIDMQRNTGISYANGGAGKDTFVVDFGQGYTNIEVYNPKEDRLDARACGVAALSSMSGNIKVTSSSGDVIAILQGSGYNLTGNLANDSSNLGIMR